MSEKKITEPTVSIRLPRTREEQGDVFVSVNERTWLVRRGVDVDVPACVAEVLRTAERARAVAFEYEAAVAR